MTRKEVGQSLADYRALRLINCIINSLEINVVFIFFCTALTATLKAIRYTSWPEANGEKLAPPKKWLVLACSALFGFVELCSAKRIVFEFEMKRGREIERARERETV